MYHTLDKLHINFVGDETSTNIEGGGGGGFSSIAKKTIGTCDQSNIADQSVVIGI